MSNTQVNDCSADDVTTMAVLARQIWSHGQAPRFWKSGWVQWV